ncbi:MAG: hypothetical protein K6C94_09485 [Candidatus Gastranaerophilales bacterium]|nr:hypothetical protein [Candidatus Gastranaerophilales bacterium]
MNQFEYQITQDGSVGLYDNDAKDILHSVTGALKESFDKFIYPTDYEDYCKKNSSVSVLDICFGIGYNTKAAIFSAIKNNSESKIYITALDINKSFAFLSPFIKDGLNAPEINLYLLSYFLFNFDEFASFISEYFKSNPDITGKFFAPEICRVFNDFFEHGGIFTSLNEVSSFLHNIYYQNVSNSMEIAPKPFKTANIAFDIIFGDARQTLQSINHKYNFVFLDGYTPHKQPLLWTYNFLELIKSKMHADGILSTYSNSTPVRKSLSELNFYIGKIILENSQFGTIAAFNKSKIKHELSVYDLGLMETKAGIPYYDNNFNLSASEILSAREELVKESNKQSATEYKKRYQNEI